LITKGSGGMTLILKNGNHFNFKVHKHIDVYDVTGAGDTVLATLAVAFSSGFCLEKCTEIANVAAGISVSKLGTISPNLQELNQEYFYKKSFDNKLVSKVSNLKLKNKHLSILKLITKLNDLRSSNNQIVFTNGCFDIFHAGHVHLIEECNKFGNILIVGINSDDSVKLLKGNGRPINSLKARIAVLNAIGGVNFIVSFNSLTPESIIQKIKPNYLVKGDEYNADEIAGAEYVRSYGGQIKTIKMKPNMSSTTILKKKLT
jgi:D-beta-D-heptose 7-phosphate kinase/D-beta-D-heptose 1-phosphate adenosyltransferase